MRWLIAFLVLGLEAPVAAQDIAASDVVVRQSVDPASGAVIGQHVALFVDVLFKGEMPRPPRVSLPDLAGVQVFRFETQGTTMRESIGGEPYVGQRFEFALYARRGGAFDIPPATVTLIDRRGDPAGNAEGESVRLAVRVPPGLDASQPVVATRRLTLDEQWTPPPQSAFKAGDAVVRTITRSADDVPALAMRDLDFSAPDGTRAYTDPPDIEDSINRGGVTGRRVDRVTYVFERDGRFLLPAVTQPWWDLQDGSLKTARAAAVTVNVAAATKIGLADADREMTTSWVAVLAGIAALVVTLVVAALYLILRRRPGRGNSEREAFAAVRHACATADAGAAYRAFSNWRRFLTPAQDGGAIEAAASLDAILFASHPPPWHLNDASALITRLVQVRRAPASAGVTSVLPPLNPGE